MAQADSKSKDSFVKAQFADVRSAPDAEDIVATCDEIKELLLEKNWAYNGSALRPARILSTSDAKEQLKVRADDKLSRIMQGREDAIGEDAWLDLCGYLILLLIAERRDSKGR